MITLALDDHTLTIAGSNEVIENEVLTYTYKQLVQDEKRPWIKKTKRERRQFFKVVDSKGGPRTVVTFQGTWHRIASLCRERGWEHQIMDYRQPFPRPRFELMHGFRCGQEGLTKRALLMNMSGAIKAPTRYGKCLGPDELVLMADGSTLRACEVQEGDLLMGPDSLPRKAAGIIQGRGPMYRIIPNRGEPWECNGEHILVLQRTFEGKGGSKGGTRVYLTVEEYLQKSKTFKHLHKLIRSGVDFPTRKVEVDPYVLGVWIGDGHTGVPAITNMEPEIWAYVCQWAEANGMSWTWYPAGKAWTAKFCKLSRQRGGESSLLGRKTKEWSANGIKRIPTEYLRNSRKTRLAVLAGIIDTDGWLNNGKCYEITVKHRELADDILFIARSLGFGATCYTSKKTIKSIEFEGTYHRISINGDIRQIPVKVPRKRGHARANKFNPLTTGFRVEAIGEGDYYGFDLSGTDRLFLLGDFTVTHNSTILTNIMRAFPGVTTVLATPGVDLLSQTVKDFKKALGSERDIRWFGGSSKAEYPSEDITICSMDSLYKCDPGRVRLLLVDEPHSAVTTERIPEFLKFSNARRIAVGATLEGRYDGRDPLIEGIFGPVLAEKTYLEAVEEGAICPIHVIVLRVPIPAVKAGSRDSAYKKLLYENTDMAKAIALIAEKVMPSNWQCLIFIQNEKQANTVAGYFQGPVEIAMAKTLTAKQRENLTADMKSGGISRCISSSIFSTGVTFSDLRCVINASGGGGSISCVQKPGRLAEIRPDIGKRCGVMVDFEFLPTEGAAMDDGYWRNLVFDSQQRLKVYRERGYRMFYVDTIAQLANVLEYECK